MVDQTVTIELGKLAAILRDAALVGGVCVFGWKARSWFQPVFDFFERANDHMTKVEDGMDVLINNHVRHMEHDLRTLSGRKTHEIDNDDMVD